MTRYLITGVAGFIGSTLAHALEARGGEVRGVDDLSIGRRENIADLPKLDFRQGDLRDAEMMKRVCEGIEVVFHDAAVPYAVGSGRDAFAGHSTNVDGTLNLLHAAREAGVRRVVFASSATVYGDQAENPKSESMTPEPSTPYATQKLIGEHFLRLFSRMYDMETVALRQFNVYGPRQDPTSAYSGVVARFCDRMRRGEEIVIHGDGEQARDFVYVDDVVQANLCAAEAPAAKVTGRAFNIGSGRAVSLNHAFTQIATAMGDRRPARHEAARAGDIRLAVADISLAKQNLGYSPKVSFEEGVRRTAEWFRARR